MKHFFLLMIVAFTALVAYAVWRGWQVWRGAPVVQGVWLAATAVLYVALLAGLPAGMGGVWPGARAVAFVGHTALVFFVYAILLFVLTDGVRAVNAVCRFLSPEAMAVVRRWLFAGGMAAIAVVLAVGHWRFCHPSVVERDIAVDGRPAQGREVRIALVSDLHMGVSITSRRLQQYVQLINAQRPDLILVAGDACDSDLRPVVAQRMNEVLLCLSAPLGVYAVPGNHEYLGGDIDAAAAYLESGNVRVLRDEAVLVDGGFYVVGRDDRSCSDRLPLSVLTEGLDRTKPVIVLDHQPYALEEAEACGVDLQLSGHTHDGQFFPVNLIVRGLYENAHGYSVRGKTHYYVSSGLGLWGPQYRIGTQSEVVVIRLRY